jgi:hypothetical protein
MLGRLDDKDALKQGYSRLLSFFSDPVSEYLLTYRGELIDGIQYSTSGLKGIALDSIKVKVQYKPYYTATATA